MSKQLIATNPSPLKPGKLNALKTGLYARDVLLPWESAAAFEKLRREIFFECQPRGPIEKDIVNSMVANRWQRERLRQTTAIAIHRHAFARILEEAGPKSWPEALATVRTIGIERQKTLATITAAINQLAATAVDLKENSEELAKEARKIATSCVEICQFVARFETDHDQERDFFDIHIGKSLEQRIRLEGLLDAQFDKLHSRLTIWQEERIMRDKLAKTQETASASPVAHKTGEAGAAMTERPDNRDELDREDDEPDAPGELDPLDEFVRDADDESAPEG